MTFDELVKGLKMLFSVIPAKPGIKRLQAIRNPMDSSFSRSDDFLRAHHFLRVHAFWVLRIFQTVEP
jgi:hypothetical protein